ncbi:hypothetical protein F5Y18DRAFT_443018 [Xylariaceae sp. FL1019]|nr:hypothetical protein F5Y18DRAFT_443018 [Xylariaceae sp. FL1019]
MESLMTGPRATNVVQVTESTHANEKPHPTNKMSVATESPVICETFPINDLPTELRWMIWNAALLQETAGRFVLLTTASYEILQSDSYRFQGTSILPMKHLVSSLLSVCRESRQQGLEFYSYQEKVYMRSESIHEHHHRYPVKVIRAGTVYINPQQDRFFDLSPHMSDSINLDRYLGEMELNAGCERLECSQDIRKVCSLVAGITQDTCISNRDYIRVNPYVLGVADQFPNTSHWLVLYIRYGASPYESDLDAICKKGWTGVMEHFEQFNREGRIGRVVKNTEYVEMGNTDLIRPHRLQPRRYRVESIPARDVASVFDDK